MRNPTDVLNSLNKQSKELSYKFQRLYRNLYNPEFYLLAYRNIYANEGSMTLSDGRPVSGSRNGRNGRPAKGREPEKNRESCRKQLNKWRGHGIIMVSCPCS